ncbi:hypothetical protein IW261DRAFT_1610382 [Armillaria novae-zelandiae]|uniref:Uncharacterized protein n=1 Tax=Armillaria novae-zelandiae TaxID=153914 RepID=A0AA39P031_9AGAR|nr:hypothetical protein IW261DRAFT_1610382 [Armillaria novae-zelandiae]
MSSIVLPSRGQRIHTTDGVQRCQCLWFLPPEPSLLDPDICGLCQHGVHAHADYVSTVVNNYPANQCAAYAQKTHLMQFCTCGAHFFEHVGTYNLYHIPEPWTVLRYFNAGDNVPSSRATTSSYSNDASSPFSQNTALSFNYRLSTPVFSRDATDIPFTPAYMSSPSPNVNLSYPYDNTVIFTPAPQPVVQLAIPQIEAHSHSEVENSYSVQYQDDNFSVNVQASHAGFYQNYPYNAAHGTESWSGQLD